MRAACARTCVPSTEMVPRFFHSVSPSVFAPPMPSTTMPSSLRRTLLKASVVKREPGRKLSARPQHVLETKMPCPTAAAFGLSFARIQNKSECDAAMQAAVTSRKPTLLEVMIDPQGYR